MKTKPTYFYPTATAPALLSVCGDVPINEAVSEAAHMVGAALDTLKALVNSLPVNQGGHNAQCAIYTLETAAGILTAVQAGLEDSASDTTNAPVSVVMPEPPPPLPTAPELEAEPEPEIDAELDVDETASAVATDSELEPEPEFETAETALDTEFAAEDEDDEVELEPESNEAESELESLFGTEPEPEPESEEPEPEFKPVPTTNLAADDVSDLEAVLLANPESEPAAAHSIDDFEDDIDADFNITATPAPIAEPTPAPETEDLEHPWSMIDNMDTNELAKLNVDMEQVQNPTAAVSPWEDDETDAAIAQPPPAAAPTPAPTPEPDSGFSALDDAAQHDPLGLCPICGRNDGYLNISKNHFAVCNKHRVFWHVGTALFDSWQHENETIWQRNKEKLKGYKQVEPIYARHLAQEGEWPRPRAA